MYKEFEEAIEKGHPFDQAINDNNPYIITPETKKFIKWDKYQVIVGRYDSNKIKESRVKHYYSPWKIFLAYDLRALNPDEYNRAIGSRRGWGIIDNKLRHSPLVEFLPFFRDVASFTYRRSLLHLYYSEKTDRTQKEWMSTLKRKQEVAKDIFSKATYANWIRFLRKLIENHEKFRDDEKILLSIKAKSYIERTVIFLRNATGYTFEKICDDVSGKFKKSFQVGLDEGVVVYSGRLEELFPDEKWDLEQNVRWRLNHDFKQFNSELSIQEQIPASLAADLFADLSNEPFGTALAAIRKINKSYFENEIWRETEVWSGIRDLAISVEIHGKQWIGGNKVNEVLVKCFPSSYDALKKTTRIQKPTDASNSEEFIDKIKVIQKTVTPTNGRCGVHLLIAHLTRNFTSHQKGLSNKHLQENLPAIYTSLLRTLFVLYAKHKGE